MTTRPWLLFGAAALLAACAHRVGELDDGLTFATRQAALTAIADWNLRGRLIIDTGERRDRVGIAWEQRGEDISLTIRPTILGAGAVRISGDAERLVVEGRGETRVLEDPEVDLSLELGWWLPVTSLEYWLLGRPDGGFPDRTNRGAAGTLATLAQRDWRIVYEEYQLAGGVLVPRNIKFSHSTLELDLTITDFSPVGS
jgi:outer membrane lipoprotein LolB